jgi:hypothetical protein
MQIMQRNKGYKIEVGREQWKQNGHLKIMHSLNSLQGGLGPP